MIPISTFILAALRKKINKKIQEKKKPIKSKTKTNTALVKMNEK